MLQNWLFKEYRVKSLPLLMVALLAGCASIEHRTSVAVPVGVEKAAGVGDVVFKATAEKSLPNAFGRADVFGRTTPTGLTTVIYEGLRGEKVVFSRASTDIDTGATTMNSSSIVIDRSSTTMASGFVGGQAFSGSATTSSTPILLPPATPRARITERSRNQIELDARELPKTILVEGHRIRVLAADSLSVRYIIEPN